MPLPTKQQVLIRDFPGIDRDQDPRDVEAGAARDQVNLACASGQLEVRKGIRPLVFGSSFEESS